MWGQPNTCGLPVIEEHAMSPNADAIALAQGPGEKHLVCGSGGSRAVLGSAGAILGCHLAGINNWRTIGGVSGGCLPTVMLAAGLPANKIVRTAIEIDFSGLLTRHASLLQILLAYYSKDRNEKLLPRNGVLSSEKLGEFVESIVQQWPEKYWTVASCGKSQWLFTADGIFEYDVDGACKVLSRQPAPLGLALRASCAVPGIIDPVLYEGKYLFDGALSMDGRCPVRVPKRHFGAASSNIIACDVSDESITRTTKLVSRVWKMLCGSHCAPQEDGDNPAGSEGVILVKPGAMSFRSLQFRLSADQKWQAVMSGFLDTLTKLTGARLLTSDKLKITLAVAEQLEHIAETSYADGELAARIEELLAGHGLY